MAFLQNFFKVLLLFAVKKNMALIEEFEKQGVWLFRYRSVLPLVILFAGILVHTYTLLNPQHFFIEGTHYEVYYTILCLMVSMAGLVLRVLTVGYTPANTSGRNVTTQIADVLNTKGMYSMVRHPLYLGNFFMWLGPAMLTGNWWFIASFCLLYWIYYERIMFAEEQFLRGKFGMDYLRWSQQTPPFFPRLKNYRKPAIRFSWKKVLKKEKNGLAAIFLIFAVFDIIEIILEEEGQPNYFYLGGCLITAMLYLILKYLKKRTKLLNEEGR
jgi:protein-S-isoprenylcysteine O-methyltransferase Ste14